MNLRRNAFWWAFVLLAAGCSQESSARADDACRPVDLREELGAPRDQANTGWCYAHTSADLISHKTRVRVSAFDLAMRFAATELEGLEQSSSPVVRDFIRANPEIGSIIDENRLADVGTLDPKVILTEEGLYSHGGVEDGALLIANHAGLCRDESIADGEDGFAQDLEDLRRWVEDPGSTLGRSYRHDIPDASRPIFQKVLGWVDQRCGSRATFQEPILPDSRYIASSIRDFYEKTGQKDFPLATLQRELVKKVDEALDQRKAIAVGYNAFDITEQSPEETLIDGDHSSTIAARRSVNGSCEYFVRNSWGEDCSLYLGPWQSRCEAKYGGVWVKMEDLKTLYSVVTYR